MMFPVDQAQFFKLFDGPVYSNQPNMGQPLLCLSMDFLRGEGALAGRNDIQDHLPGLGDAATVAAEFFLPFLAYFCFIKHINLIENDFQ